MPRAAKKRSYVAIVIDSSGSMAPLRHDVPQRYAETLAELRRQQDLTGIETFVSVLTFNEHVTTVFINEPVVKLGGHIYYAPSGGTSLFDAVARATDVIGDTKRSAQDSFLVIALTDGEENASKMNRSTFAQVVKRKQATDVWTFAWQVPPGGTHAIEALGIPTGNVREWEATSRGLRESNVATMSGIGAYYSTNAAAPKATATRGFYVPVTTDLSKVAVKSVRSQLDDVSGSFKRIEVAKEAVVKELVEAKMKRPYVVGCAYYQLMKPEKVQPTKQVLVVEKGSKAVWGGQQARELVGLPTDKDAKVTPGNHANYDIFVQSRSTNRKLPRGTALLVDLTKTKGDQPTWQETPKP